MPSASCYHCGLPVPEKVDYSVFIRGEDRAMCCPGCQAVATAIVDGGLDRFYDYRSTNSVTPDSDTADKLIHYDLPEIQADFIKHDDAGNLSAELSVSGITCSACAWLIEHHLSRVDGVVTATVNVSTHRSRITWDSEKIKLSEILFHFEEIGYEARPAGDVEAEQQRQKESRTQLLRLGVAGLGMMQAGMVAVALYAGEYQGIDPHWQQILRWVSLLFASPVVLYSARPFYSAALRSLKMRRLVMDVPVSIAILLAFAASVWGTITNTGEVYFDSVSMFAFFLLLGRFLEMRVRHRNDSDSGNLSRLIPPVATRISEEGEDVVPAKSLKSGEIVLVAGGETLPCDGEIVSGNSEVIEAILTGEEKPVARRPGDMVSAGTLNVQNPLHIRVTATAAGTRLAAILSMVDEAQSVKPHRAAVADRLSGWFVAAVLVIACAVAVAWSFIDPSRAFWVMLSVLVVTCPCALSLATPAALTVATGELRKKGFLIRKPHVLETLGQLDHCIFDKTGTLTLGRMRIADVEPAEGYSKDQLLIIAAALERGSKHPIARAFKGLGYSLPQVEKQRSLVGLGVTGEIEGHSYAFGKPELIEQTFSFLPQLTESGINSCLVLANAEGVIGWVQLDDGIREGVEDTLADLEKLGLEVELLSGDRVEVVAAMAYRLGISTWHGGVAPEEKLARIQQLQGLGHRILMVGDGINDVPVLSGADVSIAMGDAADFTRLHADSLLVSGKLTTIPEAIRLARKTSSIIKQNLGWALLYNVLAVPLAAMGYVPPWAAAIGMSTSSLIVVVNGLRLSGKSRHQGQT